MNKSDLTQTTKDKAGNEVVMTRTDKTLKQLMEEKPSSRWNVEYWHPKYDKIYNSLYSLKSRTLKEIEGENCVISGDHVRKSKGESKGFNLGSGIEYYETQGFLPAAYNYVTIKECSLNAFERLKTTIVKKGDILISCAGVGGVGKAKICIITHLPKVKSCTGDVFILRVKKLNPYYFYVFLNSIYGQYQILRQQAGTGTVNINSEQTLSILIPKYENQDEVEVEYLNILKFHDKAMEAKEKRDDDGYKTNLEIADKMLKELITKTEQVIRANEVM